MTLAVPFELKEWNQMSFSNFYPLAPWDRASGGTESHCSSPRLPDTSHIEHLISATSALSPVATGVRNHTLHLNTSGEDLNSGHHSFTEDIEPFPKFLPPNC